MSKVGDLAARHTGKVPPIWAEVRNLVLSLCSKFNISQSKEDLLAAVSTYPDIMNCQGLGYQGGFIDFLVLDGPTWSDDSWEGRGTINLTRQAVPVVFSQDISY